MIDHPLAALEGLEILGGCNHCDAVQVTSRAWRGAQEVWGVRVLHDDWCPWWKAYAARKAARLAHHRGRRRRR